MVGDGVGIANGDDSPGSLSPSNSSAGMRSFSSPGSSESADADGLFNGPDSPPQVAPPLATTGGPTHECAGAGDENICCDDWRANGATGSNSGTNGSYDW